MPNQKDSHITATEALKRLGDNAPGNSTFYKAVNDGKIKKAPAGKSNGKATYLVSWASVREWNDSRIACQGKGPKTPKATEVEQNTADPAVTAPLDPPQPVDTSVAPESADHTDNGDSPTGQTPAPATDSQVQATPATAKGKPASKPDRKNKKSSASPVAGHDAKPPSKRRTIPNRKFKNMLRHLPFEQSLDLRNWLDNRLLYKLNPGKSASSDAAPAPVSTSATAETTPV